MFVEPISCSYFDITVSLKPCVSGLNSAGSFHGLGNPWTSTCKRDSVYARFQTITFIKLFLLYYFTYGHVDPLFLLRCIPFAVLCFYSLFSIYSRTQTTL